MKKTTRFGLPVLMISLIVASVVVMRMVLAAGAATLSLTPASSTFAQGDSVSVNIYENSGSDTVNAVQANLSYPASLLGFVSISDSGAFTVDAQNSGGSGSVQVARGATTAVSGNQLVATVHFTALAAGTASLNFTSGSAVVRSSDNGAETLTTNGASYTINSSATMSLSPATKTLNKGDPVSVAIYENSGSTPVNAVQANLSYPSNLTFVSIDGSGSAFPISAQATGGSGSVKIGRGTATPVSGSQLIATVKFTASGSGAAAISFAGGSSVIRSSDNGAESLTETGASYTIGAPSTSSGGSSSGSSSSKSTSNNTPSGSGGSSGSSSSAGTSAKPPVTTNTDTKAPAISAVKVTNLSIKSATITWQTSEPATSEVDYGLNTQYILNVTDSKLTTNHSVTIDPKNLLPHTTYHFIVKSVDANGNIAFSQDASFKTEPAGSKSRLSAWMAIGIIVIVAAALVAGHKYLKKLLGIKPGGSGRGSSGSGPAGGSAKSSSSIPVAPAPKVVLPGGQIVSETPTESSKIVKPTTK